MELCVVRCQRAPGACTVNPFQSPSDAAIPFKTASGVAELLLDVGLSPVLKISNKNKKTTTESLNYRISVYKGSDNSGGTIKAVPFTFDLSNCIIVITSSLVPLRPEIDFCSVPHLNLRTRKVKDEGLHWRKASLSCCILLQVTVGRFTSSSSGLSLKSSDGGKARSCF
uniref:Uncharacterized protein n=1 Tax=Nothobranchius furzeri TaxID=105023 RepID=A0A1A8UZ32_NOTFU